MQGKTSRGFVRGMILGPALLCGMWGAGLAAMAQPSSRTLTGTVKDRQHEPLRGAVVVVQQEGTNVIVSYLTDSNGQFSFKHLSPSVDYQVTATYRGKTCHAQEMSHFDSKLDKVMNFIIVLE